MVSTFIPINTFTYQSGAAYEITISGGIDMQLKGTVASEPQGGRKLQANELQADKGGFDANGNGQGAYEIKVDLQGEATTLEEAGWEESSGAILGNKVPAALVTMILLLAAGMW